MAGLSAWQALIVRATSTGERVASPAPVAVSVCASAG